MFQQYSGLPDISKCNILSHATGQSLGKAAQQQQSQMPQHWQVAGGGEGMGVNKAEICAELDVSVAAHQYPIHLSSPHRGLLV